MMGPRQEAQALLFYEFSLEDHVPQDHLLRSIDRFVDLTSIRAHLANFYSHTGRPSVDPELVLSDEFELVSGRPVRLSFIPRQVRATRQERRIVSA